jgi:predicted nucleic acid-binding protein
VILVDTNGLYRALDGADPKHQRIREVLEATDEPLILSPFVLAELDYFIESRLGKAAQLALLAEVEAGSYELQLFDENDVTEARAVIDQYAALPISLADASIVVLARKLGIDRVLTCDGHFRTLQPGGPTSFFTLLPDDV